jgi:magnesium chelatase subunit I
MEFLLHGLSEYSLISRNTLERGLGFGDLLSSYMSLDFENEN